VTNFPAWLYWVDPDELSTYIQENWDAAASSSQQDIVEHNIKRLKKLHHWNDLKGWALFVAMILQVGAIFLIAVTVFRAF
jgi:cell division protein FtsX